ncbi:unnamed protein product [Toxocara canis]|uniref:AA_permease domain-containing protein n=1 Tax=Toxocara canis TaxID=6265 RepID=A0A183U3Y8_TOXCA|nr:unnamed protein product [Toxocara canis]
MFASSNSPLSDCFWQVIMFVVCYGFTFADFSLWSGRDEQTGQPKFMPFGLNGLLAGAASCFFACIGFDGLATAEEKASGMIKFILLYICGS